MNLEASIRPMLHEAIQSAEFAIVINDAMLVSNDEWGLAILDLQRQLGELLNLVRETDDSARLLEIIRKQNELLEKVANIIIRSIASNVRSLKAQKQEHQNQAKLCQQIIEHLEPGD